MRIRDGSADDDAILTRHYLALWENGTPPDHFRADAETRTLAYIAEARAEWRLGAFIAEEGSEAAGSAACQLFPSPYPDIVAPEHRLFGYIWSVYVDPRFRRRGIARALCERAIAYLDTLGCTTVVLHASEAGEPLYEQLGFELGREMRLKLR